jgi:hypothetical protein
MHSKLSILSTVVGLIGVLVFIGLVFAGVFLFGRGEIDDSHWQTWICLGGALLITSLLAWPLTKFVRKRFLR